MNDAPRVALITDSFHEVNGAARALRELEAYARRKGHPFLTVRWGGNPGERREGSIQTLEMKRSHLAFPIDPDLYFDPLFYGRRRLVQETVRRFQPDLVHIIGPGDLGILGAIAAAVVKVPLVLSWHTNLHEFAERRVARMLWWLPGRHRVEAAVNRFVLDRVTWFFGRGDVLLAPSPVLVKMLEERTGKPVFYMGRGVDTDLFSPERRKRDDDAFTVGYVGRLMPEKSVRFLADVAKRLASEGEENFRVVIVGSGPEQGWLRANVQNGCLAGILHGEDLGRQYANFDVFAFPSRTDTFGQVVQEAQSAGVPAVVTDQGGPQFIVEHEKTGYIARSDEEFLDYLSRLRKHPELRREMSRHARQRCLQRGWDQVCAEVYKAYEHCRNQSSQPPKERNLVAGAPN